jgi:hypothetical protein
MTRDKRHKQFPVRRPKKRTQVKDTVAKERERARERERRDKKKERERDSGTKRQTNTQPTSSPPGPTPSTARPSAWRKSIPTGER